MGGPTTGPLDCMAIEQLILKENGFFVSSRVIRRKSIRFTTEHVHEAMQSMTRDRGSVLYVGSHKTFCWKSTLNVFYTCPPNLVQDEALEYYGMSRQEYENAFFESPKPKTGAPANWNSYFGVGLNYSPFIHEYPGVILQGFA